MRMFTAPNGIAQPLSNREYKFLERCMRESVCKRDLTERESYIAQQLVSRGILEKAVKEKTAYYRMCKGNY